MEESDPEYQAEMARLTLCENVTPFGFNTLRLCLISLCALSIRFARLLNGLVYVWIIPRFLSISSSCRFLTLANCWNMGRAEY